MIHNIQETETLFGDEVPVMVDGVLAAYAGDVGAGSYADYVLIQISYSEQMAQYTDRNKIYLGTSSIDCKSVLPICTDAP